MIVCAVTFPIVFLSIQPTPQNLMVIMAAGFVVATIGVMIIIFAEKVKLVLSGVDVNANFELVDENGNPYVENVLRKRQSSAITIMRNKIGEKASKVSRASIASRASRMSGSMISTSMRLSASLATRGLGTRNSGESSTSPGKSSVGVVRNAPLSKRRTLLVKAATQNNML